MKIVVGSRNPTKVEGARIAFEQFFGEVGVESIGIKTKDQPFDEETIKGAIERAIKSYSSDFDFSVGIEAGLMKIPGTISGYMDFQVAVVFNGKKFTLGFGPGFEYPPEVVESAKAGIEVGKTMEKISGINQIGRKVGAVYYLSKGVVSRVELSRIAVTMALLPWINKDLYKLL
ncbi:MAG: inosine/xanthosine triphosphatase [Archaeoglobaceae archaeon]|nr:inosine/xanthosine triphosphatase [Archaeoglobaceae archaeon]MDW7989566.1 inosine/xanthosine triphosphatase [Archaeoglobaceae archaeon]